MISATLIFWGVKTLKFTPANTLLCSNYYMNPMQQLDIFYSLIYTN